MHLLILEHNGDTNELQLFVKERNNLHVLIEKGNLERVKEFVATSKSKLYLNTEGKSAILTAIEKAQYQIYAFLKFKGMNFKNEEEQASISNLNDSQKGNLRSLLIPYFPQSDDSHIFYLLSKTRSANPIDENFKKEVQQLYEDLNNIPEISTILKVVQYSDYLDIIVDFNNASTIDVDPTAIETTKGQSYYKEGRLYLGAKGNRHEVLGTLAHEFTHLAMQVVYDNDCNPYGGKLNNETKFKNITKNLLKELTDIDIDIENKDAGTIVKAKENIINSKGKDEIITRAFTSYTKEPTHWPSELVVRVPHMLTKYGKTDGRQKLEEQVPELLNYYEGNVLPSYDTFIQQSFLIKSRNIVQSLNQSIGEVVSIVESEIKFKDSIDLNYFVNNDENKKILLLNTKSTWLSILNVYQTLQNIPSYVSHDSYLILKFDRYAKQQQNINKAFFSEVVNLLVVECPFNLDRGKLSEVLNNLSQLLKQKPNKKIIFIVQENEVIKFRDCLNTEKLFDNCLEQKDKEFTLNDLTLDSQSKILEKKVIFQGKDVCLNELIDKNDENSKKLIDSVTLVKLINEKIRIGNTPSRLSDSEAAYATLNESIEISNLGRVIN